MQQLVLVVASGKFFGKPAVSPRESESAILILLLIYSVWRSNALAASRVKISRSILFVLRLRERPLLTTCTIPILSDQTRSFDTDNGRVALIW